MSSPTPRPQSFRVGSFRGFLPLSEDVVSTRGQRLPSLIQRRSSIGQLGPARRQSMYQDPNEESDLERDSRISNGAHILMTPQMRSMRLIGNNNPRYKWEQYYKTEEELKTMKKPIRQYYERNNYLISQYLYIDRLLDSSLPHNLIQEYNQPVQPASPNVEIPHTISENSASGSTSPADEPDRSIQSIDKAIPDGYSTNVKVKRTPKAMYKLPDEETRLLDSGNGKDHPKASEHEAAEDDGVDGQSPVVTVAIYINLAANAILLAGKIVVIVLTSSLSVLASLVDAALDFLSTAIVWTTTRIISRQDEYSYPVGRRRLEPVGVLIFSIIMITAFFQVALQCFQRLTSDDHSIVELGLPAIIIMSSTVLIKFGCWLWCRLINNSSVQALAQDAMTDVVFNIFSIIFPLVGYYFRIWYLDALGGLLLSLYVIINWARTSTTHIRHLTGFAAPSSDRALLLYLTMRFARTIKAIQGLQAYHTGDMLNVEVDVVLDEGMSLRDSHDLGESLQYVLESVPRVERAFVHLDYAAWNLPNHMSQRE
ncbi:hypothetical protein MMC12_004045 [Toensbergia leucococca]|nr:hypothetical protein [Toensbergia leucococca]